MEYAVLDIILKLTFLVGHRLGTQYIQVLTYRSIRWCPRVVHGPERYLSKSNAVGNKTAALLKLGGYHVAIMIAT